MSAREVESFGHVLAVECWHCHRWARPSSDYCCDDCRLTGEHTEACDRRHQDAPGEVPSCAGRSHAAHERTAMASADHGWRCPVCGEMEPEEVKNDL